MRSYNKEPGFHWVIKEGISGITYDLNNQCGWYIMDKWKSVLIWKRRCGQESDYEELYNEKHRPYLTCSLEDSWRMA